MSYDQVTQELVNFPLTPSAYRYLARLRELGALEGPLGKMKANPSLTPLIHALHTVLSGGEVSIIVVRPGNPDVTLGLEEQLARSQAEANELNARAGSYITTAVP